MACLYRKEQMVQVGSEAGKADGRRYKMGIR